MSREGTHWDQVLFVLIAYRPLAPGSEWLHREGLVQAMTAFRYLPDDVRQIVILVIRARFRAMYESYAHPAVAKKHGVSDAAIDAIVAGTRQVSYLIGHYCLVSMTLNGSQPLVPAAGWCPNTQQESAGWRPSPQHPSQRRGGAIAGALAYLLIIRNEPISIAELSPRGLPDIGLGRDRRPSHQCRLYGSKIIPGGEA